VPGPRPACEYAATGAGQHDSRGSQTSHRRIAGCISGLPGCRLVASQRTSRSSGTRRIGAGCG
jgi:hypothetical protein